MLFAWFSSFYFICLHCMVDRSSRTGRVSMTRLTLDSFVCCADSAVSPWIPHCCPEYLPAWKQSVDTLVSGKNVYPLKLIPVMGISVGLFFCLVQYIHHKLYICVDFVDQTLIMLVVSSHYNSLTLKRENLTFKKNTH